MDLSSLEDIRPFYVMEILEKALKLQSLGRDIVHLEIGEPTENVDNLIINSAQNALNNNLDKYTNSFGIESLREKISQYYKKKIHFKKPNDLLIQKKKICGILQEKVNKFNSAYLIVGIGVNLIKSPFIRNYPTTHLRELINKDISKKKFELKLKKIFENNLKRLIKKRV